MSCRVSRRPHWADYFPLMLENERKIFQKLIFKSWVIWHIIVTKCLVKLKVYSRAYVKDIKISGLRENCCKFRTFYRASFCFIITNEWTFFPSAWERRQEGGDSIRLGQDQDRAVGTQCRQVGSRIEENRE